MRFRLFYSFSIFFSFLVIFKFASASDSDPDPRVTLKIHAVGQGNCVSLEVRSPNAKSSEFMLVDIGSTSFANEAVYRQFQVQSSSMPDESEASTNQPTNLLSTPPKKSPLS